MAIIKCKMCGGELVLTEGSTVAQCEYCGSMQTVPSADNAKKLTLFTRANRLRAACEFDKAAGVYETIVADFAEEAEAYWGLVLCKYGIEYVDDPGSGKKVPTCHRSSFQSVLDDSDFEQALENADAAARKVYREEAKQIEEIRKGIIEVSGKEKPYDIFICYKETADNGERTLDSVLAQDIYDELTRKDYRVFFARITLEDKLGQEYEPYIFAALNSAKVMLAVGTDYEYYNAVWVKNEWSRYLKLMAEDHTKHLIPCYKGIDAYDMPKEFAKLQAQDLGKVGAMQDLLRGIEKLLPKMGAAAVQTPTAVSSGDNKIAVLLDRGNMALEDGQWKKAEGFFEEVLNLDSRCARAYLGLAMCEIRAIDIQEQVAGDCMNNKDLQRAKQFADASLLQQIAVFEKELSDRFDAVAKRRKQMAQMQQLFDAGAKLSFAVRQDGTVLATKYLGSQTFYYGEGEVSAWRNIIAVSSGYAHTLGLQADGTVVAVGENRKGRCDVSQWRDIVAIDADFGHSLGLKADGTVVAAGDNGDGQCNVSGWTNIVAVSAGMEHSVGLRADGTVVAIGSNKEGQCDVAYWENIVAICADCYHSLGLRADGTVVATGKNHAGQCDVADWRDIIAISTDDSHSLGLRADGTVVATNYYGSDGLYCGKGAVSGWRNMIAVSAGTEHSLGLRADGTVVSTQHTRKDKYYGGQCEVSGWKLFHDLEAYGQNRERLIEKAKLEAERREEQARLEAERRAEEARLAKVRQLEAMQKKRQALQNEQQSLQTELANLRGLFTGKRRKEIEARLAQITKELKELE